MGNIDFIKLLGGLGMFLLGMYLMEESIKKIAGHSLKKILKQYTSGKFKSITVGILATTILQSSSALSLVVLAFVGAGVLQLKNAIGLILGANIGSTTTGWIVALLGFKFNIEQFALPLIGIGGFLSVVFSNKQTLSRIFQTLSGAGLLFLGLSFMKFSVEGLAQSLDPSIIPKYGLILYFFFGILSTAILQASSATVAIVLTALNVKILSFHSAAAMIIGADVGTTVTILLGAIGGETVKRRVAFAQVGFNLITGIAALIILPLLVNLIHLFIDVEKNPIESIVLFHSSFNILGVIVFLPFINRFSKFLENKITERKITNAKYINHASAETPESAIMAVKNEIIHLFRHILLFNSKLLEIETKLIFKNSNDDISFCSNNYQKEYKLIKILQYEILTFSAAIQKKELRENEIIELERLMHALRLMVHSAKTMKDIRHNFEEFEWGENAFTNKQYDIFRKRMLQTYLQIEKFQEKTNSLNISNEIVKSLLLDVKKADKEFLHNIFRAINNKEIKELEISNIIVTNRAFVQSCRQLLLSMKELFLNKDEYKKFESGNQREEYLEIEDN